MFMCGWSAIRLYWPDLFLRLPWRKKLLVWFLLIWVRFRNWRGRSTRLFKIFCRFVVNSSSDVACGCLKCLAIFWKNYRALKTSTSNSSNSNTRLRGMWRLIPRLVWLRSVFYQPVIWSRYQWFGDIQFAQCLERDNIWNVLAEPNLTAVSGEQAGFLAGGEFPCSVGRDRDGTLLVWIQTIRGFWILNLWFCLMTGLVCSCHRSILLDPGRDYVIGYSDPSVSWYSQVFRTTVEINSVVSLMMAGLLKSENIKGMAGLPG